MQDFFLRKPRPQDKEDAEHMYHTGVDDIAQETNALDFIVSVPGAPARSSSYKFISVY